MKKQFLIYFISILSVNIYGQSPEKFSYQAIIRNSGDAIVANTGIVMQISILKGSAVGTAVYIETHSPTTNANGLVSIEIGGGSIVSGTFTDIDWSNDAYFIKTETDPTGGTSYTITGTSQLLSVPYALQAKKADEVPKGEYSFVDGTTDFSFVQDNQWHQFSDLTTSISLTKTADVLVTYNTSNMIPAGSGIFFVTRLKIDGIENKMFRSIQGNTSGGFVYFSNNASGVVSLGVGTHTFTVEYRTNGAPMPNNNGPETTDYTGRGLTVKELK